MFSNWIFAGEKLLGEFLAENEVQIVVETVLSGEEAASNQWDSQDAEVLRIDGAIERIILQIEMGCGTSRNRKDIIAFPAAPRRCGDECCGSDSRQTAHALEKGFMKRNDLLARIVLFLGKPVFDGQHVVGRTARSAVRR